jgi:tetratricopeptide (TPR) repeat protein
MSARQNEAVNKFIREDSRALDCFTDRDEAVQLFCRYVNGDPAQPRFLFFYGVGGNGKTLLLRFLRKHWCRVFDNWKSLKDIEYASLLSSIDEKHAKSIPAAYLDFGTKPNGEDRPQEAFPALLMLRRSLSDANLRFPLYDFACIWYLHKTRRLSPAHLANLFPAEELGLLSAISDVVTKTAFGSLASTVLNVFSKHFQERATVFWHKRKLETVDVERIQSLDAETELMDELPGYFGEDLNGSMQLDGAPARVVLFFDTHEAFWGHDRGGWGEYPSQDDEWFRCLLSSLQPEKGIVVACAGREIPKWHDVKRFPVPDSKVEFRLIGNLSGASAQEYLIRAHVADAGKRALVCTYAEVEPGQVHPLFLGLCADIILEASERNIELAPDEFVKNQGVANIGEILIDRFLRYVDEGTRDAVRAVCACRAFDRDIYFKLARELHFNDTDYAFRKLTRFSFVSPVEGRSLSSYKVHDLLRRLIQQSNDSFELNANRFLEAYYREISGPAATAEAIYHASRLDQKRAVKEWVKAFDKAYWLSDYPVCRALLAVRSALGAIGQLERAMIARCEGEFCEARALYAESEGEYNKALQYLDGAPQEQNSFEHQKTRALVLTDLGELLSELSRSAEATACYEKVVEICEVVLGVVRDDGELHSIKAAAYLGLGEISLWASKCDSAIKYYSASVEVCNHALQLVRDEPFEGSMATTVLDLYSDKAYGLGGIGEAEASLYRHRKAIRNYRQAISCYDEALGRSIDPVIQNDKAYTLVSIAESEIALSRNESALKNCDRGLAMYGKLLQQAPEDVIYRSNMSRALRIAGDSLACLGQCQKARQKYEEAIEACSEPIRQAPTDLWALCCKGLALVSLGKLLLKECEYSDALGRLSESLDTFESFLAQSPDDSEALAGKGQVLSSRGDVFDKTGHQDEAVEDYRQAVVSFEQALKDAADDAETRIDKGHTLKKLGELYLAMDRREDALRVLDDGLAEYSRVLQICPHYRPILECKQQLAAFLGTFRSGPVSRPSQI